MMTEAKANQLVATSEVIAQAVEEVKESICPDCGHTCSLATMIEYCPAVEKAAKDIQPEAQDD